jgi:hypothetical protein
MRRKIILSVALTAIAAFAFAPTPALAHGDRVSVKDSYMPGAIASAQANAAFITLWVQARRSAIR